MRAILLILCLVLGACGFTSTGDQVRKGVAEYGARAMDEGLVNAVEEHLCRQARGGRT